MTFFLIPKINIFIHSKWLKLLDFSFFRIRKTN